MLREYFTKPIGKGSKIAPYMFLPHRLLHACNLLLTRPGYFIARIRNLFYQYKHSDHPWLTEDANTFLDNYLKAGMTGFEWGSGRSTLWFVKKGVKMISVESDYEWYQRTASELVEYKVKLIFVDPSQDSDNYEERYAGKIEEYPDNYFDLIVIDGNERDACIRKSANKVKYGGVVVVDNADEDIDVSAFKHLKRISTSNGVWRTDIFVYEDKN